MFFILIPITFLGQGISFISNDKLIKERTSYNVFDLKQPTFGNAFSLEFDLSIEQLETFGYIFTIKDINEQDALSLIYINNNSVPELRFNVEGKENLLVIKLNNDEIGLKRRIKCLIRFDFKGNQIKFEVNNHRYETTYAIPKAICKPQLVFGKTDHSIDVPAFRLRNLKISSGKINFNFHFNESEGNIVYDTKGRGIGHVTNPIWLINDSFHWKLKKVLHFDEVSAIAFSKSQQKIIITQKDSIGFFDLFTEEFDKVASVNRLEVPMRLGLSIINDEHERLVVYELNDVANDYNIASLHLDSMRWSYLSVKLFDQQRHHHNSWFDEENNRLYIFGGYGNKRFTNSINYFDFDLKVWCEQSFKGDVIFPRFFSGIVKYNRNEILLFGGAGNKSGDQSLGKEYYKDCYRVNLSTNVINKLWEINRDVDFVSSRNMILSKDSASFYTLNYEEYIPNTFLQLYKYSIENGISEPYGDSIPMISERIRTNANLYLNKGELYCVIQEFELSGANVIKIYSIDFPPVTANQLIKIQSKKGSVYLYMLITVIILLCVIYYLYTLKLRKRKTYQKEILYLNTLSLPNISEMSKNNSISLFGNFKVIDRNGRDISYLFSPKVKHLLLILLLNCKKEDGVSSEDIYDALWPDKEKSSAKNLKNVTINQLRKILTDLDGIKIVYDRTSFKIVTSGMISIDFLDFQYHLNHFNDNTQESLNQMYSIISKGPFLKGASLEYFDKEKQLMEDQILNIVENILDICYKSNSYRNVLLATHILLSVDPVNETALGYRICTYKKLKMMGEAKKEYNSFLVEYLKAYNENFNKTFNEIVSQSPERNLVKPK
ncbi:hypothetical protein E9993_01910 [Labilibacter sediminis]|nr:hypothetical protein E9993_01910 [Labilibacter sediminis]